jgi:hypothetical protein
MNRTSGLVIVMAISAFLVLVTVFEDSIDKVYPKNTLKPSVYDSHRAAGQRWHAQEASGRSSWMAWGL